MNKKKNFTGTSLEWESVGYNPARTLSHERYSLYAASLSQKTDFHDSYQTDSISLLSNIQC